MCIAIKLFGFFYPPLMYLQLLQSLLHQIFRTFEKRGYLPDRVLYVLMNEDGAELRY